MKIWYQEEDLVVPLYHDKKNMYIIFIYIFIKYLHIYLISLKKRNVFLVLKKRQGQNIFFA